MDSGALKGQAPLLVAIPQDAVALGLHVHVGKPEPTDLADTHARVEQGEKQGFVPPRVLRPPGCGKQHLDLGVTERIDLIVTGDGNRDGIHRRGGKPALGDDPGEQRFQMTVVGFDVVFGDISSRSEIS